MLKDKLEKIETLEKSCGFRYTEKQLSEMSYEDRITNILVQFLAEVSRLWQNQLNLHSRLEKIEKYLADDEPEKAPSKLLIIPGRPQ